MDSDEDVMFPVPWRVQVEFLETPPLLSRDAPSGIPTEIVVPPLEIPTTDPAVRAMLVQMFPAGARFIDEVTGQVYRVVKRRVTGDNAEQAFLTLDREVCIEDINLSPNDPRCQGFCASNVLDYPCDLLRTVWVFPPPVEAARAGTGRDILVFQGSQPVVDIEVRTLRVAPSE